MSLLFIFHYKDDDFPFDAEKHDVKYPYILCSLNNGQYTAIEKFASHKEAVKKYKDMRNV